MGACTSNTNNSGPGLCTGSKKRKLSPGSDRREHTRRCRQEPSDDDEDDDELVFETNPTRTTAEELLRKNVLAALPFLDHVTPRSGRSSIMRWVVAVHKGLSLDPQVLPLAVNLLDRLLGCRDVSRSELSLLGVSAILVAAGSLGESIEPDSDDDTQMDGCEEWTTPRGSGVVEGSEYDVDLEALEGLNAEMVVLLGQLKSSPLGRWLATSFSTRFQAALIESA
eukprot:TRINITY_DN33151_c0_g2_i2.p1 TRINITY_DN33151_c0_g2~~TRINITY_DN33151_c0_g2_i2.p1  ORF type:complete len:224 (-),score=35.62 TRINITY_DN33151_c0_g2_i2:352-1023(-)